MVRRLERFLRASRVVNSAPVGVAVVRGVAQHRARDLERRRAEQAGVLRRTGPSIGTITLVASSTLSPVRLRAGKTMLLPRKLRSPIGRPGQR